MSRKAKVLRQTHETKIEIILDLDGFGHFHAQTGLPFFEHMLEQVARHGLFDISIKAEGDLHIDAHHTVEDIGITFGMALNQAMANRAGIFRYGCAFVPLDEALSRVVIDYSGRSHLTFNVPFTRAYIGNFDLELVREFFQGLVNHARIGLHIDNLRGENAHHQCETLFKAFGRALRMAIEIDSRAAGIIPSTKGVL